MTKRRNGDLSAILDSTSQHGIRIDIPVENQRIGTFEGETILDSCRCSRKLIKREDEDKKHGSPRTTGTINTYFLHSLKWLETRFCSRLFLHMMKGDFLEAKTAIIYNTPSYYRDTF